MKCLYNFPKIQTKFKMFCERYFCFASYTHLLSPISGKLINNYTGAFCRLAG